jgi:hypothetical protein
MRGNAYQLFIDWRVRGRVMLFAAVAPPMMDATRA